MTRGETPHHHIALGFACLLPDSTQAVGVGDADSIVASMLIELGPGGGLNCKHALVGCCVYPSRSVAIRDVPCAKLCSGTLALTVPLGEPLTAQFTLTLLLIKHQQGNLLQFVAGCVDAVGIEFHGVVCVVCTIPDRPSAVGKHCEMCINHQVDHLISGRHAEAVAPPVHRHLGGAHGIEHEHVQFFESVALDCHHTGVFEFHALTIHGLGCCAYFVCHFGNWSEAADLGINQR